VFTSKDRFHAQVVPLFLDPFQTFVHGDDLKADLKKLDARYSALSATELQQGLMGFAAYPPDETDFLVTQLWDKYLPGWRGKISYMEPDNPEYQRKTLDMVNSFDEGAPGVHPHDEHDVDKLDYVTMKRMVLPKKENGFASRVKSSTKYSRTENSVALSFPLRTRYTRSTWRDVPLELLCFQEEGLVGAVGSNPTPCGELSRFYHVCPVLGHTAQYLSHRRDCKQKR
jgi:hypothetical protein